MRKEEQGAGLVCGKHRVELRQEETGPVTQVEEAMELALQPNGQNRKQGSTGLVGSAPRVSTPLA